MNTRQMLEKRTKLVRELSDLQDAADATSDGAMTDEQAAAFDAVKKALAELEDAMQRRAHIEDMERRGGGQVVGGGTSDVRFERELHQFSVVRAIAAGAGMDVDAGREREISQEVARRSGRPFQGIAVPIQALRRPVEQRLISTTTPVGDPGSNLIATLLDGSQQIDLLRAGLVIRQAGARILSGLTSNVDIPRLAQAAAVGWAAENTPLTSTQEGFDKVSLRPKHAGAIVELSRNMLQQSTPDIEQLVRADLAAVLARALDSAAIYGTGTANDPVGILNTPGVPILPLGTNGGPLNFDAIADLMALPMAANAMGDAMAFIGNTATRQHIVKMTTTFNMPIDLDTILEQQPNYWSNLVPGNLTKGTGTNLSALIYGNWSDLIIAFWSELDLLINPFDSVAYSKGNVLVRAMMTCDVQVRHPQSFAAITDINTVGSATVVPA